MALLNMTELAAELNISERQIRDLVYKRRIPFVKVGRLLRFDRAAIDLWLQANSSEAL